MRKVTLAVVVLVGLLGGCGDDGGATTAATTTLPPLECPDPITVSSSEDLVAVLAATPWEGLGGYTSGPLPVTSDLVVSGTVVLEAADLPIPADCLGRSDCPAVGGFRMGRAVPGVLLEGEVDLGCTDGASRMTLTNTTLRLRPVLYDTHPCRYNFVPLVTVVPPCGTACESDQTLCPVDGACYATGGSYCRLCQGGSKEACACQGPAGPLPEGASCTYWQSGDVQCGGRCRQGVCQTDSCP